MVLWGSYKVCWGLELPGSTLQPRGPGKSVAGGLHKSAGRVMAPLCGWQHRISHLQLKKPFLGKCYRSRRLRKVSKAVLSDYCLLPFHAFPVDSPYHRKRVFLLHSVLLETKFWYAIGVYLFWVTWANGVVQSGNLSLSHLALCFITSKWFAQYCQIKKKSQDNHPMLLTNLYYGIR